MYWHFGRNYFEMGKENKFIFRNYIIYLPKNPKKYQMRWEQNLALNNEMRWKQNLAFNNDDGKKTIEKTICKTLFTKIIYIKKINK